MKCDICLTVDTDDGEREITITGYNLVAGYAPITSGPPDRWQPGEPDRYEDIEAKWTESNKELTQQELEDHLESIEEAISIDQEADRQGREDYDDR